MEEPVSGRSRHGRRRRRGEAADAAAVHRNKIRTADLHVHVGFVDRQQIPQPDDLQSQHVDEIADPDLAGVLHAERVDVDAVPAVIVPQNAGGAGEFQYRVPVAHQSQDIDADVVPGIASDADAADAGDVIFRERGKRAVRLPHDQRDRPHVRQTKNENIPAADLPFKIQLLMIFCIFQNLIVRRGREHPFRADDLQGDRDVVWEPEEILVQDNGCIRVVRGGQQIFLIRRLAVCGDDHTHRRYLSQSFSCGKCKLSSASPQFAASCFVPHRGQNCAPGERICPQEMQTGPCGAA